MMIPKHTFNIHDASTADLKAMLEMKYKKINSGYKMLKRLNSIDAAKKQMDEIWRDKAMVNDIELELLKREVNDSE